MRSSPLAGGQRVDREFHYYLTYLTAARAGFSYNDALTIAQACQAVDDNLEVLQINSLAPHSYSNYVSQTMDLLRPRQSRMRIYPVFHFIPGEPDLPDAERKDGATHVLNTTPDSPLANQCFDAAAATGNLMQIGIASHAYADTWAHQNFVGYKDEFNGFKGTINRIIPNIGHADAKHAPDWPGHIWTDSRLVRKNRIVNNNERFLKAAGRLYEKFCMVLSRSPDRDQRDAMLSDFGSAIGKAKKNPKNSGKQNRMSRYRLLAQRPEYHARKIPDFKFSAWRREAIESTTSYAYEGAPAEVHKWKSITGDKNSNWYRFQEAVKAYQRRTLEIYEKGVYRHLSSDMLTKIMKFK